MRRVIWLAAIICACTIGQQQPSVDPAAVLRQGAGAMAQLKTVSATLKFSKGAITFQGFTLVSARTSVVLPSDSDTTYTVKEQDITISFNVVITQGHVYLRLPLSSFRELTGAEVKSVPDLAKLFDPTSGLPAVIPAGIKPTYISTDQVNGKSAYQITTAYTADQVHALFPQLNTTGSVTAGIWVNVSDHLIPKAVLDGLFGDGGKESMVEVDMTGFNATVNITSPSP